MTADFLMIRAWWGSILRCRLQDKKVIRMLQKIDAIGVRCSILSAFRFHHGRRRMAALGFRIVMALSVPFVPSPAADAASGSAGGPEVELVHWWISPGESAALDVFREAVEERGGIWKPIAVDNYLDTKIVVSKRLQLGLPPTLTQWISGDDLMALHKINRLGPMPQEWRGQPLRELIFDELFDMVQKDGVVLAIPVGVHMQNYALHNAKAYAAIGAGPPARWRDFLDLAPKLAAAGYVPIATSSEDWQIENLFVTIGIDLGGVDLYYEIYGDNIVQEERKAVLAEAFAILRELRGHALEPHLARNWVEVTRMVADGEAATMIMGDFAKGDMVAAGLEPGRDFLCSFAPGNQGIQLWSADVFSAAQPSQDDRIPASSSSWTSFSIRRCRPVRPPQAAPCLSARASPRVDGTVRARHLCRPGKPTGRPGGGRRRFGPRRHHPHPDQGLLGRPRDLPRRSRRQVHRNHQRHDHGLRRNRQRPEKRAFGPFGLDLAPARCTTGIHQPSYSRIGCLRIEVAYPR
ncbi:MAG: ABC transporter substrate-binding protein [Geminicoccaceae bacterium]